MLEKRELVGGAAVSEEIFPGYIFSRASYVLSLLRSKVIEEIFDSDWKQHLILYKRDFPSFTPTKEEGKYLLLSTDEK
jgi:phytoene dehydrogenase-like protein